MTVRLADGLKQARRFKVHRVVCDKKGMPLTQKEVQVIMRRVGRRANVKPGVHILRLTFCSHLAMRSAPAKAIQEPAALDAAIRLLDEATSSRGSNLEAAGTGSVTA